MTVRIKLQGHGWYEDPYWEYTQLEWYGDLPVEGQFVKCEFCSGKIVTVVHKDIVEEEYHIVRIKDE